MIREFQKIYSRTASVMLLAAAVFISIGMGIFFLCNYEYEVSRNGETVIYEGLRAVKMEKDAVQKIPSVLSVENLNESVRYYHSFSDAGEANEAYGNKYPGWRILFDAAYVPVTKNDAFVLQKRKNADDFYEQIEARLLENMQGYDGVVYSKAEKERAAGLALKVKKPYVNEFMGQWTILIKASYIFFYVLILYAVFLAGQVFSYENDCGMDLVLMPCGKKHMLRISYQKLGGVFLYLTLVFLLSILAQAAVVFACCGTSGGRNSIQVMWGFFFSLYAMTAGEFFLYSYAAAWVSILCIAAVSAFLNACTKNKYLTVILTALFLVLPTVAESASQDRQSIALQRFAFLQPVTGTNVLSYGPSLRTFALGPVVLRGADAVMLVCVILFAAAVWTAPKVYWKRMQG